MDKWGCPTCGDKGELPMRVYRRADRNSPETAHDIMEPCPTCAKVKALLDAAEAAHAEREVVAVDKAREDALKAVEEAACSRVAANLAICPACEVCATIRDAREIQGWPFPNAGKDDGNARM